MTNHFVESKLPVCFVFSQIFEHKGEPREDFERVLHSLDANFNQQLEENWIEHWQHHGEEIVLEQWKLKYEDYLALPGDGQVCGETDLTAPNSADVCTAECTSEQFTLVEPHSAAPNSADLISTELNETETNKTASENYTDEWAALWRAHAATVYFHLHELHATVYEQYYLDFKRSLEPKTEVIPEVASELGNLLDSDSVANELHDLHELLRLGLPTEFGSSNPRQPSTKRNTNHLEYPLSLDDSDCSTDDMEDAKLHKLQEKAIAKPKNKKNRKLRKVPAFMLEDKNLLKYYRKRFSLFSRFDEGIALDPESWFSVTPEKIAVHQSQRLSCDIIVDAFCGCGGNTIQFARTCNKVIAVDIDPVKLAHAKHNAGVYGVADKIEFICADFLQLCESANLVADVVFLSPPWGGPKYKKKSKYDIEEHLLPASATELMRCARRISENIGLYLPRNADPKDIVRLAGVGNRCEIQHNYLDTRLVAVTGYYGQAIIKNSNLE